MADKITAPAEGEEAIPFQALEDFENTDSSGRVSYYMKDQNYRIRPDNQELADCVKVWLEEGKVTLDAPVSKISATGKVE